MRLACVINVTWIVPQVFIYVNKRASLMDTTSCRPAYHTVEPLEGYEGAEPPFPIRAYDFTDSSKVWYYYA
jgi:hypothetical protein